MSLLDELKEKRTTRINNWDARQAQISEHQAALRGIEVDIADLDAAIAALELSTLSLFGDPQWTQEELAKINAKERDPIDPNLLGKS